MAAKKFGLVAGLVFSYAVTTTSSAQPARTPLQEIWEAADKICVDVAQSGKKSSAEINAQAKAQLAGLLKRLSELGVNIEGKADTSQFEGVLQEQLADTLKDVRQCKMHVFDKLEQKLLPQSPQPVKESRDPDGLYQYGEKVAEVQGANFQQGAGSVQFQAIRTAGKADPAREFEYRDWVITCPQLPAPRPNSFYGQFSGVVAGATCGLVKKRDQ